MKQRPIFGRTVTRGPEMWHKPCVLIHSTPLFKFILYKPYFLVIFCELSKEISNIVEFNPTLLTQIGINVIKLQDCLSNDMHYVYNLYMFEDLWTEESCSWHLPEGTIMWRRKKVEWSREGRGNVSVEAEGARNNRAQLTVRREVNVRSWRHPTSTVFTHRPSSKSKFILPCFNFCIQIIVNQSSTYLPTNLNNVSG